MSTESGDDPPPFAPFPLHRSERLYDSPWCGLRRDWIELNDGTEGEYHVFEIPDAVAIVPVLPDGSIVMVWQHRHPHGKTHWETPAGRVQDGEAHALAAHRELLEETGYGTERMELVAGFHPINGISPHFAHIYVAWDCTSQGVATPEASERLSAHVRPVEEVRGQLLRGGFEDGFTALSLFYMFARPNSVPRV